MVEHRLAKARVASSNLVSRSRPPSGASRIGYGGLELNTRNKGCPAKARYPSGKGEVCKTFMRRFDPGPRLHTFPNNFNPLEQDNPITYVYLVLYYALQLMPDIHNM